MTTSPSQPEVTQPDPTSSPTGILFGLMTSAFVIGIYISMFSVAIPTIRDTFAIQVDVAAWVASIYLLPFMMFMPLYGRLGDAFGQRRLFLLGVIIFTSGTVMASIATGLGWLMVGRAIQGVGAAGAVPLSIAIITQRFPVGQRGRIMGTWNSVFPLTGIIGPYIGGLLIDYISWRAIFFPTIILGFISYLIIKRQIPGRNRKSDPHFWQQFDWGGVSLLSGFVTSLLFYTSSRPITGVEPLRDWRLLGLTIIFLALFLLWEQRQQRPFIPLPIFKVSTFALSSICASIRMVTLNSTRFLVAFYLVDIYGTKATTVGVVLAAHAIPLFITLRIGGQIADRFGSRTPTIVSLLCQTGVMAYLTFLEADSAILLFVVGILAQSLTAGLSLAPLHRASMMDIPSEQTGIAAGLYSMIRFAGSVFGAALSGVLLQQGLDRGLSTIGAYHQVFWFVATVALVGAIIATRLKA